MYVAGAVQRGKEKELAPVHTVIYLTYTVTYVTREKTLMDSV